jgi:hypothetical protein
MVQSLREDITGKTQAMEELSGAAQGVLKMCMKSNCRHGDLLVTSLRGGDFVLGDKNVHDLSHYPTYGF